MHREANTSVAYGNTTHTIGTPNKTVTNNSKVLTGKEWTSINRKYCIESGATVSHHQHQN